MIEITGTINSIVKETNNGHEKKVLTLKAGNTNILYIEFQGNTVDSVSRFVAGDRVTIKVRFNGKTSKLGRRYNNLIGKSIKPSNNANSN